MPTLTGSIGPWGPTINVKVMQSNQRVRALKKAGLPFSSPCVVPGLIDTGASVSALDESIVTLLGLAPRNIISIHTPSTGAAYEKRMTFEALVVIGETLGKPLSRTIAVISCELATQGFLALIGRDLLQYCRLIYDGPQNSFTLEYDAP
jgi:hypothetical protein